MARAPLYSPQPVVRAQQQWIAVNLLLTTLATASPAAPFKQNEWPSLAKPKSVQSELLPNLLASTLGQTLQPFVLEWENATQTRRAQPDLVQNLLTTVLATAPAAAPFNQEDWPNPGRRPIQRADAQSSLLTGVLAPAAGAAPFSQDDWTTPSRRIATQVDVPVNLLLTPGLAPPFLPVEVATSKAVARAFQADPPNLLAGVLAPAAVAAPFSQDEWSTLAGRRAQRYDEPPNLLGTTLATATLPFSAEEWTPLRLPNRVDSWQAPNLQTGTLAPAFIQAPFAQLDWPLPARYLIRLEALLGSNAVLLTAPPAPLPFSQTEWPNPRARVAQAEIPSNLLPLNTLIVPRPFVAIDWSAPKASWRYTYDAQGQPLALIGLASGVDPRYIVHASAARGFKIAGGARRFVVTLKAPRT